MSTINIEGFYSYPLKSAKGISLNKIQVEKSGFEFDRIFGLINSNQVLMTARENPNLLLIEASFNSGILQISIPSEVTLSIDVNKVNKEASKISLFKNEIHAQLISHNINESLSSFLNEKVKLVYFNPNMLRKVKEEYNAKPGDEITFNDVAPIHLINKASVEQLNLKLEYPVLSTLFRPNIIISGAKPYAEETWKSIKIGECEFELITQTERCSVIVIDPDTAKKHSKQEPLRTLSKSKKGNKVNFGMYLVPRKLGVISLDDEVEILN